MNLTPKNKFPYTNCPQWKKTPFKTGSLGHKFYLVIGLISGNYDFYQPTSILEGDEFFCGSSFKIEDRNCVRQ